VDVAEAGILTTPGRGKASTRTESEHGFRNKPKFKRANWLLVASGKGGSGKTTTSYNVAVEATLDGLHVLLVDLDGQQTLTRWHASRPAEAPRIEIVTKRLKDLTIADFEEIDRKAAETGASLVVVDTPPGLDDWPRQTRELVGRAEFVLVPTSQGGPDVDSVVEWMAFLQREGARAAFVLNRTERRALSYEDAKTRLNRAGLLCPIDVRRLADIEAVYRYGVGVAEMKGANGTQDIEGIWHYLRHAMEL
jgi:chromosome partitioning protein